jgi:hypothetical protein
MSTLVWCDHVRHVVEESRTQVAELVSAARHALILSRNGRPASSEHDPLGFVYLTVDYGIHRNHQRALNVEMISSFEAFPDDAV